MLLSKIVGKSPTLKLKSITRLTLEKKLIPILKKLKPGIVLDMGSLNSPYKKFIPSTRYLTLDINKKNNPDICCDIHNIKWQPNYFDTIIATEVLEHLKDPKKAVSELYKITKKGGVCIATTRFIYPYHPGPKDYYRFTEDSLKDIFSDFSSVKIIQHGNRLHALWQLLNYGRIEILFNIFNKLISLINFKDRKFCLGYIIYAKK